MGSNKLLAKLRVRSGNDQGLGSGAALQLLPATAIARAAALAVGGAAATMLGAVLGSGVMAAPKDGVVRQGQATITQGVLETSVVQRSERAIIDWRSIDLRSIESLRFYQPAASSMTLNRVTGGEPSQILGNITANGNVLLVNPQGIVFGPSSRINVGGLVATTANIADDSFMQGGNVLRFDQAGSATGQVVQQGVVTVAQGGLAAFVARQVRNEGYVTGRLSRVAMAGADRFVLDLAGDSLIRLTLDRSALEQTLDAQGRPLSARVDQLGQVRVEGGRIELLAGTVDQLLDNAIHVKGDMRAVAVEGRDGVIRLTGSGSTDVELSGVVQATGATSRVDVSGRDVKLLPDSRVDIAQTSDLGINATRDIRVESAIDGRLAAAPSSARVQLNAARDISIARPILTKDAAIGAAASGALTLLVGQQLGSGTAPTQLAGQTGVRLDGQVVSVGDIRLDSASGSIAATTPISGLEGQLPRSLVATAGAGIALSGARIGDGGFELAARAGDISATASLSATGSANVRAEQGSAGTAAQPLTISSSAARGSGDAIRVEGKAGVYLDSVQTPGDIVLLSARGDVRLDKPFSGELASGAPSLADAPAANSLRIDAAGQVRLSGGKAGAGGISIGSSLAPAGLQVDLIADLISGGEISFKANGQIDIQGGLRADRGVDFRTSAGGISVGSRGVSVQGDDVGISLRAATDIRLEGSLRATNGTLRLVSERGDIVAKVLEPGADPAAGDALLLAGLGERSRIELRAPGTGTVGGNITVGGMQARDEITIEAGNDAVLLSSVGGTRTGYTDATLQTGYRATVSSPFGVIDNRPQVGRLTVRAGSAELNGLNLDGVAQPNDSGWALDVEVRNMLLSNAPVAVNRGGIRFVSSASGDVGCGRECERAGLYLGADVFVRGHDTLSASGRVERVTYPIQLQGRRLVLFDNGNGVARVPDIFEVPLLTNGRADRGTVFVNVDGRVVDPTSGVSQRWHFDSITGVRTLDANGQPALVMKSFLRQWQRIVGDTTEQIYTVTRDSTRPDGQGGFNSVYAVVDVTTGLKATSGITELVAPNFQSQVAGDWTAVSLSTTHTFVVPEISANSLKELGYSDAAALPVYGLPTLRDIAKITIGNNGNNYGNAAVETPLPTLTPGFESQRAQIQLSGPAIAGSNAMEVVSHAGIPSQRVTLARLRDLNTSYSSLTEGRSSVIGTDGVSAAGRGIGLKLIGIEGAVPVPDQSSALWFGNMGLFDEALTSTEVRVATLTDLLRRQGIASETIELVEFTRDLTPILSLSQALLGRARVALTGVEGGDRDADHDLAKGQNPLNPASDRMRGVALVRQFQLKDGNSGYSAVPLVDLPIGAGLSLDLELVPGSDGRFARVAGISFNDATRAWLDSVSEPVDGTWIAGARGANWNLAQGFSSGAVSLQSRNWAVAVPGAYVPLAPSSFFDITTAVRTQPGGFEAIQGQIGTFVRQTDGTLLSAQLAFPSLGSSNAATVRKTASVFEFASRDASGNWQIDSLNGSSDGTGDYFSANVLITSSADSTGISRPSTQMLLFPSILQYSGLRGNVDSAQGGALVNPLNGQASANSTVTAFGFPAVGPTPLQGASESVVRSTSASAPSGRPALGDQMPSPADGRPTASSVPDAGIVSAFTRVEGSQNAGGGVEGIADLSLAINGRDRAAPALVVQPRAATTLDLGRSGSQPGALVRGGPRDRSEEERCDYGATGAVRDGSRQTGTGSEDKCRR